MNEDNDSSSITHRISTEGTQLSNELAQKTCHFAIKPSIKEVINSVQFREMLESDFSERSAGQPLSLDDKKFLSQMEQGIRQRKDGHYEMPLPPPNNKSIALHRLTKRRTRMENDKRCRDDYINFMNELIEQNYAKTVPESELANEDGNCMVYSTSWCI